MIEKGRDRARYRLHMDIDRRELFLMKRRDAIHSGPLPVPLREMRHVRQGVALAYAVVAALRRTTESWVGVAHNAGTPGHCGRRSATRRCPHATTFDGTARRRAGAMVASCVSPSPLNRRSPAFGAERHGDASAVFMSRAASCALNPRRATKKGYRKRISRGTASTADQTIAF